MNTTTSTPLSALKHHVSGAIARGEMEAIVEQPPTMNTYKVYWSPEGKCIATVRATSEHAARRQAPMPYRRYLGEIYAEKV